MTDTTSDDKVYTTSVNVALGRTIAEIYLGMLEGGMAPLDAARVLALWMAAQRGDSGQ